MIELFGKKLPVWKTNLHTHTTVSDGKFTPEEVIRLYREAGYHALALTDHRQTNPVSQLDGEGMLILSGIEMHPVGPRDIMWHVLAVGVPEDFAYDEKNGMQDLIDRVNEAGGICFSAHPYWSGFTAAEVMSLKGLSGVEVFNTSTVKIGKPYNMQLWDEILDTGLMYNAIAVDDIHNMDHAFKGWTMIAAGECTAAGIMAALHSGSYYATQGPEITRLSYENGIFEAEFTPCGSAILMSNRHVGYGLTNGEYTSLSFNTENWPKGNYIRLQLTDAAGNFAWSNPLTV